MKNINRFLLCTILIFITLKTNVFAQNENQKITVSNVRVFLDDKELFEKNLSNDKILENEKLNLSTILSFTSLKAGKEFSSAKLEKEIEQTKLRLLYSGLFYTATVEKINSRKNPGTVIIYINVTTGFLKRFSGGGIYGVFGNAGLRGNREQLLCYLGWNKNGASYKYEYAFNTPLILGAEMFTNLPSGFLPEEDINVNGKFTIGSFITPDFRICLDTAGTFNFNQKTFEKDFALSPYLSLTKYYSKKFFSTTEVRFFYYPLRNWEQMFDTAYTVNYSPFKNFTIATLVSGGYATNNTQNGLSLNHDNSVLYDNLGLANRGIRSGYSNEDLQVRGYFMGTLELRWNALSFTIPPCFPLSIVPYVFADVAAAEKLCDSKGNFSLLDAYGLGIQLNFESPVFAYFNFSYGFNHEGKGKFCFAAVQSF